MLIADAFAGIAVAFSKAGLGPYVDSFAQWPGVPVLDDGGSIVTPGEPVSFACQCQVDTVTEAMRAEAGYVDRDIALIVLTSGLGRDLDTDATITINAGPLAGASYSVQSVARDSMSSHWLCRGRRR